MKHIILVAVLADYCTVQCQYNHLYRNTNCTGMTTPSPMPTMLMGGGSCHSRCGSNRYIGLCLINNKCLCWWGRTGPDAVYINAGTYRNRIVASNCKQLCHYTHIYRNPSCITSMQSKEVMDPRFPPPFYGPRTTRLGHKAMRKNSIHNFPYGPCAQLIRDNHCDPRCDKFGQGQCQSDGRCLCWWGWTGPNATYVTTGIDTRIKADYCDMSCHYTNRFVNPQCASTTIAPSSSNSTATSQQTFPAVTSNSTNTSTPSLPSHPSTSATLVSTTDSLLKSCDPKCESFPGQGQCQSDGRCLCWWGWTGPNATYIVTGNLTNRIMADYCTESCHYTHDYLNTSCASIPTPRACSVPPNTSTSLPCKPECGTGVHYGQCLSNGRCLCWWGWTGPNSCFVDGGDYNNRII
ncbi:hypothetical protein QZH41_017602, partial [Actinostola sp. cb2023]